MYPMVSAPLFQLLLVPTVLLLLLGFAWMWQRRKRSWRIRLQVAKLEDSGVKASGVRSGGDMSQGEGSFLEAGRGILKSLTHASTTHMNGACLIEIFHSDTTSGQLAAMVQRRAEEEDVEQMDNYQATYPWIAQSNRAFCSPWSNAEYADAIKIQSNSIEFHHDSKPQEVWRRRVLAFVGQ